MESPILNRLLPQELLDAGFSLAEDEHFVYLKLKGSVIGSYNASRVTPERLVTDAYVFWEQDRWLQN